MNIRETIWLKLTKNFCDGNKLPVYLIVLKVVLFPIQWLKWVLQTNSFYDFRTNSYTIEGITFSKEALLFMKGDSKKNTLILISNDDNNTIQAIRYIGQGKKTLKYVHANHLARQLMPLIMHYAAPVNKTRLEFEIIQVLRDNLPIAPDMEEAKPTMEQIMKSVISNMRSSERTVKLD